MQEVNPKASKQENINDFQTLSIKTNHLTDIQQSHQPDSREAQIWNEIAVN